MSDFSKKENQIGCGYCAKEANCNTRVLGVNSAKQGCKSWQHHEDDKFIKHQGVEYEFDMRSKEVRLYTNSDSSSLIILDSKDRVVFKIDTPMFASGLSIEKIND